MCLISPYVSFVEYHFIQAALKRLKNDVLIEYTDLFYEEKSFTVGAIKAEKRSVNFFLTHGADQGPESFGIFCSRIFTLLKPKTSVLLGTCAARDSEKFNIADVAFGHSAYNYEEGKYMDEKTFNPDLLRRYSDLAKSQIGGFLAKRRDQYLPAIFLTGSAVRQDANVIFNNWQKPRQADVLEMEASAFFNSCEHCHVAALGVVKGVSDYGDKNKYIPNSIDYSTTISNATQAAVELSKYYCNGKSFTESPLESHGAQLAMNYCQNFLRNAATGILDNVKKVEYKDMEDTYEKKLYLVDPGVDGLAMLAPENLRYHAKKLKLEHIAVGVNELRPLTLYYKNGKILDYPTTLKGLKDHPEKTFNYEQFKSTVEQQKREMRMEKDVTFISIDELEKQIAA